MRIRKPKPQQATNQPLLADVLGDGYHNVEDQAIWCMEIGTIPDASFCMQIESTVTSSSSKLLDIEYSTSKSVPLGNAWAPRLRYLSNLASFICVLDCTILPLVTCFLPLLNSANLASGNGTDYTVWIDDLGHTLARLFVLPVGSLSAMMHFYGHRKLWISSMAIIGIVLIGVSNLSNQLPSKLLYGELKAEKLHTTPHGIRHRLVNVLGCLLLLYSNYLAQKYEKTRTQCCLLHAAPFPKKKRRPPSATTPLYFDTVADVMSSKLWQRIHGTQHKEARPKHSTQPWIT